MARQLKRTTEEVAAYFREQGCELLDEYLGCLEPMEFRCKCGMYSAISWNNFTKGKRCGYCVKQGLKKKLHIDQVRELFKARDCEFLDNEYRGIHYKHRYKCKCGSESEISLHGFRNQNQNCKACGLEKLRGHNHPQWQKDREALRLKQLFRKKCYKALSATLEATGKEKVGHTSDMIGYGPKQLQEHIMSHPNWHAVKDGDWDLDHIWPIQAFLDHGITDLRLINCLENLRPLGRFDNQSKHDKYDLVAFREWLVGKRPTQA